MTVVELPSKEPVLKITTMPNDANPKGDIFGGWLMSQMDIAGAVLAVSRSQGNVATVAVRELVFENPLYIHDLVSFYALITEVGNSSIKVEIDVYAQRLAQHMRHVVKVATATFIYVAIDEPGIKRPIPKA